MLTMHWTLSSEGRVTGTWDAADVRTNVQTRITPITGRKAMARPGILARKPIHHGATHTAP
ncbi:MAG: hypothetical protein ACLQVD_15095 [Capsulimonadaceae bacterium]